MRLNAASAGRLAHTFFEPRGVVLAISAFNHPFNLIIHQVITAVAAGCPVLAKPARTTPLSCQSIVERLHAAGCPEDACQLLLTDNAVTERLVQDSRVAFLTFIGSARVGWHLRSKLAPGAACVLEHGGVAPVIVDASADLDDCIPRLVRGGFYHAGQVCVSVQRIYVQACIAETFATRLTAAVRALSTGDPLGSDTEVGPLITPAEVQRVDAWVQEAVQGGGQLLCGGQALSRTIYAPTLLQDPPEDARITQEEVFGPVVALYRYDTLDEAIARANTPQSFFQAAIFTRDIEAAWSAARRLSATAVMINDHTAFRVDWMPFGGHRSSGLGLGGIGQSMRDMSLERMVVWRSDSLA
ncbi:MAG: aldehyde dehydrogenase family protein [Polyangiales bacterium]